MMRTGCCIRSSQPFTNIYSIEELCYYLYHNIYLLDETIINEQDRDGLSEQIWKLHEAGYLHNRSKRKPEKTARRASGRRQLFLGKRCGFLDSVQRRDRFLRCFLEKQFRRKPVSDCRINNRICCPLPPAAKIAKGSDNPTVPGQRYMPHSSEPAY